MACGRFRRYLSAANCNIFAGMQRENAHTVDLGVKLGALELPNPLILASGTCGYGYELAPFLDPSLPGAVTLKGLTLHPRSGNPPPRLVETPCGVLNAIGLQNMGITAFLKQCLPRVRELGIRAIANISGNNEDEYVELCRILQQQEGILAVELNVSCPNVREGGIAFGQDARVLSRLVGRCRPVLHKPLIVKLSPNVTDIRILAQAAAEAGADALSLINTLLGMAVDIETRRPLLANTTGGLSGPAIKPVALRMVHQVASSVTLPIIGMGGICTWQDAVEFLLAGAHAVAVGTATMVDPAAAVKILEGLRSYMERNAVARLSDLVGALQPPSDHSGCV